MIRKTLFFAQITLFLVVFCQVSKAENIYTTSLNLKKNGNLIVLEWKANTNQMTFLVYRSPSFPIANPSALSNARKIGSVSLTGVPDKDLFKFPPYSDKVTEDGKYYYLVLPDNRKVTMDDFYPNLNYNISPIAYKNEEPVAGIQENEPLVIEEKEEVKPQTPVIELKPGYVKNIFIKTNLGVFQVFWDMDSQPGSTNRFTVYRTVEPVTNVADFARVKPYRTVLDEYFLEDTGVQFGVPYYYTIIANDYKIILPGMNQNAIPVFIGNTNAADIRVEREVYRKVRVNTRSFNERFKQ